MTRLARVSAAALLAGAALASGSAKAQISNGNGPIDVTADQLEMVDAQHLAIWRGNVEAVQNGNRLVSDIMNVYFQGNGAAGAKAAPKPPTANKTIAPSTGATAAVGADWGAVKQLVADGHVFFVGDNQTARGNHAVYDLEPDTITMTGDVVVVQGDNVIKGDKLVIQVKTGHADVISNATGRNKPERVRGVFYNSNQPAPAAPAK